MPRARLPLNFDITSRTASTTKDSRLVNALVEGEDIIKRPGLVEMSVTSTVTMTIASPAVVTYTAHGFLTGQEVVFTTTGALPTGITSGTTYYVITTGLTTNTFQVSATLAGSAVDTSGSQSGTHSIRIRGQGQGIFSWNNYIISCVGNVISKVIGLVSSIVGSIVGTQTPLSYCLLSNTAGGSATITTTFATNLVNYANHNLIAGQAIIFTTSAADLPAPIVSGDTYYIVEPITEDTFSISTTPGGAILDITDDGTGTHTATTPAGSLAFHNGSNIYTIDQTTYTLASSDAGTLVLSATINVAGGWYDSAPTVTFTGGGLADGHADHAAGTAVLVNHRVDSITITDQGAGTYTSTPIITMTGTGTHTPATFTCLSRYELVAPYRTIFRDFAVTNGGTGYFTAPSVTFTNSNGGSCTKTTTVNSSGVITAIESTHVYTTPYGGGLAESQNLNGVANPATPPDTTTLATANMNATISGPYAPGMVYLDGYVYVLKKTPARIYGSALEGPKNWNALNFISSNSDPDTGVGIVRHLNYIVAFGKWSTEFFYNAGLPSPGSPLSVNQGAKLEIGCANGFSIAKADQTIIWVGSSLTTGKSVYLMDGLKPVKISTRYIDKYLNDARMDSPTVSMFAVRSYCFKVAGHTLYVLILENQGNTFVYDLDEKKWYFWTSQTGDTTGFDGTETYFSPSSFTGDTEYDPGIYLQDDHSGKIYIMSPSYYNDAGDHIYFRAVSPLVDSGSTKRKFYKAVETIGDKITGNIYIRKSDNDYATWSSRRTVDLSLTRPILRQYGEARRRAWEVFSSDDIPIRLQALEMDFDIGEEGGGQEG